MEPFLFLGLPAVAVVQLVRRSAGKDGLVFDEDRMTAAGLQILIPRVLFREKNSVDFVRAALVSRFEFPLGEFI